MKARIPGGAQGGGQMAMMKKIQEMQAQLEQKQAEIEASEFTASAGGGAVEVTVTGAHEVKDIRCSPMLLILTISICSQTLLLLQQTKL